MIRPGANATRGDDPLWTFDPFNQAPAEEPRFGEPDPPPISIPDALFFIALTLIAFAVARSIQRRATGRWTDDARRWAATYWRDALLFSLLGIIAFKVW